MRYYYLIFADDVDTTGSGFLMTFDKKQSTHNDNQGPWLIPDNKYRVVWYKPLGNSDNKWIQKIVSGGMATRRIFDSHNEKDCRRLIDHIFEKNDEGLNI